MKFQTLCLIGLIVLAAASSAARAQPGYAPLPSLGAAAGYYAPAPPPPAPIVPGSSSGPAPAAPPASMVGASPPVVAVDADCDDLCKHGYWTVGGGLYFMTPYFTSNPAFYTGNGTSFTLTDFHQHMSVSPLAWIGYTWDNGWGVRFRWFQFEGNGDAGFVAGSTTGVTVPTGFTFLTVSPGSVVSANDNMHLNVYDLEATALWKFSRWSILGTAGLRYAQFSQNYQFNVIDPVNGNTNLTSGNNFNGVGPTMSLEARRQIGDSEFFLYGSARGSLLFGASHQYAAVSTPLPDPFFSAGQTTVLSVGELEIGGEWARVVGRMRLFAQAAFIGQAWCGGNNASLGIAEFNLGTGVLSNFGFIGGVVRAGVSF